MARGPSVLFLRALLLRMPPWAWCAYSVVKVGLALVVPMRTIFAWRVHLMRVTTAHQTNRLPGVALVG